MALAGGITNRLTKRELQAEPRALGVIAWFDGWTQAQGGRPADYPRRLTTAEAADWREGWNQAKGMIKYHDRHGFGPCDCDDPCDTSWR